MDYTKVPRALIYKDREDLKDFGVLTPTTADYHLFKLLKSQALLHMEGAKDIALKCFNNAYYICKLIQLEEFPDLFIVEYEKKLLNGAGQYPYDVCAASMAMVYLLMPMYDSRWDVTSDWASALYDNFHHREWHGLAASKTFYNMVDAHFPKFKALPGNRDLAPRDIIDAIENVSEKVLVDGKEYVCEALSRLDDPLRQTYGADLAIARLKDLSREYQGCKAASVDDFDFKLSLETAIIYYTKHYPSKENVAKMQMATKEDNPPRIDEAPKSADTDQLTARINELQSELDEARRTIKELQEEADHWKDELAAYKERNQNRGGINRLQTAYFGLIVAPMLGINVTNKKELAPMLSKLFGWGQRSMEQHLCKYVSKEDEMEVAKIFGDLSPELAVKFFADYQGTPEEDTEAPPAD